MNRFTVSTGFLVKSVLPALSVLALGLCLATKPAHAATAELYYSLNGSKLTMGVTVTMTGYSRWDKVDYHCTGRTYQPVNLVSFRFGPGTFSTSSNEEAEFLNLTSGNYTIYAIASGMNTATVPYTDWYASTGDTYFTIP